MTRADHVVALGGGVVGDLAGFCAATYQRGVPVVQVPTTLVAQVDSAYGGKTGVDLPEAKNYVGAYHQPAGVLVDPDTLATLPARGAGGRLGRGAEDGADRRRRAVGARRRGRASSTSATILACARTKLAVVAADERDGGRRQVLNLGHTVGHAIETATGYARYRHGEAVGLGLLAALRLSGADELREQVRELLAAAGCRSTLEGADVEQVLAATARDKKRLGARRPVRAASSAPGEVAHGCAVAARRAARRRRGAARAMMLSRDERAAHRIAVMHGVNLDQLGRRDPALYGTLTLPELEQRDRRAARELGLRRASFTPTTRARSSSTCTRCASEADAIMLNPGAWTHYAWAIRDALEIAALPARRGAPLRRHSREPWRRVSVIGDLCFATVSGAGPTATARRSRCCASASTGAAA